MADRPTEIVATYQEMYNAIKGQMMEDHKISKKYTEDEVDMMVKDSLVQKANDKVRFRLNSEKRHGAYRRYLKQMKIIGNPDVMEEGEYYSQMEENIKKSLAKQGFVFKLSSEDLKKLSVIKERITKESIEEATKITAEALKKILTTTN